MDQATEGSIGVTVVGNRAEALVRNCAGYATSRVELNNGSIGFLRNSDSVWTSKSMVTGTMDLGSRTKFAKLIPLGSPSPLYADPHGGAVDLTRAQIANLTSNQVLASTTARNTVSVSRAEFEQMARQMCASQEAG